MTLRRGVTLSIALVALLTYGYMQAHTMPALSPSTYPADSSNHYLITEPETGIAPVISFIESASSSVDLVMYQLQDSEIEQALVADKTHGITVRVLLNGGYYGKKESGKNDAAYQYLSTNGVAVAWTPTYFALTHQKTVVVDGKTAMIMTMNLTPQYYASGREFIVVDSDSADVSAIEDAFTDDWNNGHATASNGDSLVWSPGSESAILSLINNAQTSLDIYNEEMADTTITNALEDAARRGVTVRVDMTYASEWKKAFTALTGAGVTIHTFATKAPLYIHAKVIVADDSKAFIGSENFSSGSLNKNRELGIIVSDQATIGSLEKTFETDWASAIPFTP
jgi:cardiolipin synthase